MFLFLGLQGSSFHIGFKPGTMGNLVLGTLGLMQEGCELAFVSPGLVVSSIWRVRNCSHEGWELDLKSSGLHFSRIGS